MRRHLHTARDFVLPIVDFFYPPFRVIMNLQTFRYAACGGFNTVAGLSAFYIAFKFILKEKNLDLSFYVLEPYSAALFISFLVSFPIGFFLMKYVVFSDSKLKGRIQIFRYLLAYVINLVLNYFILRLFVELLHIYPTIAQAITTAILIVFSYLFQRYFTFKATPAEEITNVN